MPYERPQRNLQGIKHEHLRQYVDRVLGKFHDEISEAYYNGEPLVLSGYDFGVLSEGQFKAYHGLSHDIYVLGLHVLNKYLAANYSIYTPIPESEYRYRERRTGGTENNPTVETVDLVANSQAALVGVLSSRPQIATYEFDLPDPVTSGSLKVTLQDLANYPIN